MVCGEQGHAPCKVWFVVSKVMLPVMCGEQGHAPCNVWFMVSKVMLPVKCGLW